MGKFFTLLVIFISLSFGAFSQENSVVKKEEKEEVLIAAYPNPFTGGDFTVTLKSADFTPYRFTIYNSIGSSVYKIEFPEFVGEKSFKINFGDLPKGFYVMEISQNGSAIQNKRLSVN